MSDAPAMRVESESEFEAVAVNDESFDFLLRLARLIPEYNIVLLKALEITANGRRIIPLGIQTNSVDVDRFMKRASNLRLKIELQRAR